ncbi:MAG: sel1 repeat family protein [Acutalibacter sp.]|nr:sel1 repeat family protein [Acutalibacter sp.]
MAVLVILVIIFAIIWFYRSKSKSKQNDSIPTPNESTTSVQQQSQRIDGPTPGVNRCAADALINSPYYAQYKGLFDYIWYDGKQPKYKVDWLLQSLDMGHEIESGGYYIMESMKQNLPYFCETEDEYDYFFSYLQPIDSVEGMEHMCVFYSSFQPSGHPAKQEYWKQRLCELAITGNLRAQAALCSDATGIQVSFSDDERKKHKEKYRETLFSLAESGNAEGQLAVGEYLSPERSQEKIEWLTKAANQGLSDAWYQLHSFYLGKMLFDDNGGVRQAPLSEEEKQDLEGKMAEYVYKGAEANNGAMAGWCQHEVGNYYAEGNSVFAKDLEKAKYWYQRALENGVEDAEREIRNINEHPEWYQEGR